MKLDRILEVATGRVDRLIENLRVKRYHREDVAEGDNRRTVVVYCLNMVGDAVRDLLDLRLRGGSGRLGAYGAQAVSNLGPQRTDADQALGRHRERDRSGYEMGGFFSWTIF